MSKSDKGATPTVEQTVGTIEAPVVELTPKQKAIEGIMSEKDCGKGQATIRYTIDTLSAKRDKDGLNMQEIKILLNNKEKLDCKSPSRVYKNVERMNQEDRALIMGKSAFPTFDEFVKLLPEGKVLFSMWDAFGALVKANRQAATKSKIDTQGGEIIKDGKKAA